MSDRCEQPMLVELAAHVATSFPELEGRSIAVSEVEPFVDKTNVPSLPMAVVALVNEQNTTSGRGGATAVNLVSDVLVQFIFEPTKYKDGNNVDTPFFAFYDYERLRNQLLEAMRGFRPGNLSIAYRTLDVESDPFAVYVAFRFNVEGKICFGATEALEFSITTGVKQASGVCQPCAELPSGCDLTPNCEPPAAHEPLPD